MIERFGERRKIDVPAAFGMPSGHAGLECPQCGCGQLPAVRSRRVKNRVVRTRAGRATAR